MAFARAAASTITDMITRARVYLGDRATTPGGGTNPTGFRRWSDTEITDHLNNALIWMGTEMQLQFQGDALTYADLTYTEPAGEDGMDLPAGVDANAIYEVEDRTNDFVETVRYVSHDELKQFDRDVSLVGDGYRYAYTLIDRGLVHGIMMRPIPQTSRTLRIWYAATPIVAGATSDSPLVTARWRDFVAQKAALALLAAENELPIELFAAFKDNERQFRAFCARRRGPTRIKMVPRGLY